MLLAVSLFCFICFDSSGLFALHLLHILTRVMQIALFKGCIFQCVSGLVPFFECRRLYRVIEKTISSTQHFFFFFFLFLGTRTFLMCSHHLSSSHRLLYRYPYLGRKALTLCFHLFFFLSVWVYCCRARKIFFFVWNWFSTGISIVFQGEK